MHVLTSYLSRAERGAARRMAQALGVTQATVSRWASGHRTPTPEHKRAVVEYIKAHRGRLRARK